MEKKRHNPDQIIRKLREVERMKAEGKAVAEICQALEISEQTLPSLEGEVRRRGRQRGQAPA